MLGWRILHILAALSVFLRAQNAENIEARVGGARRRSQSFCADPLFAFLAASSATPAMVHASTGQAVTFPFPFIHAVRGRSRDARPTGFDAPVPRSRLAGRPDRR